jgi:hypothetical protein
VDVIGKPRTPFTPAPDINRRREFTPPGPVEAVTPDGYDKLFEDINRATDVLGTVPRPVPPEDGYDQIFENINQATNVVDPPFDDVNRATNVLPQNQRTVFDPVDQPIRRYSYRFVGNQRVAIPR